MEQNTVFMVWFKDYSVSMTCVYFGGMFSSSEEADARTTFLVENEMDEAWFEEVPYFG